RLTREPNQGPTPPRRRNDPPGEPTSLNPPIADVNPDLTPLPPEWRAAVPARLGAGERLLCWFTPDLNTQLHYAEGLVVLTDRRLLAAEPGDGTLAGADRAEWACWELVPDLALSLRDRAGLGTLELRDSRARLAHWRFTLARGAGAHRLLDRFEALQRGETVEESAPEVMSCPSCGEPVPAGQAECP